MSKKTTKVLLRKDEQYLKQLLGFSEKFKMQKSVREEIEKVKFRIEKLKKDLEEL